MERALRQDERIRRAEEIYARRQNTRERTRRATVNVSQPKNFRLLKRVILQAVICLLIYFIFYLINTTNYSFSAVTLDKTNELLSNDFDFVTIFNNIKDGISDYINSLENSMNNKVEIEETKTQEEINSVEEYVEEKNEEDTKEDNANEEAKIEQSENLNLAEINNNEDVSAEEISDVELSETDRIKKNYSFIVPVKRLGFF